MFFTTLVNSVKLSRTLKQYTSTHSHLRNIALLPIFMHKAEDAYPEGWQDNQYASPDAVKIMTIHQAKGMQWPVVFIPALLKNRFPAKKMGGKGVWHILPREGVIGQDRFEGTVEDDIH